MVGIHNLHGLTCSVRRDIPLINKRINDSLRSLKAQWVELWWAPGELLTSSVWYRVVELLHGRRDVCDVGHRTPAAGVGRVSHLPAGNHRRLVTPLRHPTWDIPLHMQTPGGKVQVHPGDLRENGFLRPSGGSPQRPVRRRHQHSIDYFVLGLKGFATPQFPEARLDHIQTQVDNGQPQVLY